MEDPLFVAKYDILDQDRSFKEFLDKTLEEINNNTAKRYDIPLLPRHSENYWHAEFHSGDKYITGKFSIEDVYFVGVKAMEDGPWCMMDIEPHRSRFPNAINLVVGGQYPKLVRKGASGLRASFGWNKLNNAIQHLATHLEKIDHDKFNGAEPDCAKSLFDIAIAYCESLRSRTIAEMVCSAVDQCIDVPLGLTGVDLINNWTTNCRLTLRSPSSTSEYTQILNILKDTQILKFKEEDWLKGLPEEDPMIRAAIKGEPMQLG